MSALYGERWIDSPAVLSERDAAEWLSSGGCCVRLNVRRRWWTSRSVRSLGVVADEVRTTLPLVRGSCGLLLSGGDHVIRSRTRAVRRRLEVVLHLVGGEQVELTFVGGALDGQVGRWLPTLTENHDLSTIPWIKL